MRALAAPCPLLCAHPFPYPSSPCCWLPPLFELSPLPCCSDLPPPSSDAGILTGRTGAGAIATLTATFATFARLVPLLSLGAIRLLLTLRLSVGILLRRFILRLTLARRFVARPIGAIFAGRRRPLLIIATVTAAGGALRFVVAATSLLILLLLVVAGLLLFLLLVLRTAACAPLPLLAVWLVARLLRVALLFARLAVG